MGVHSLTTYVKDHNLLEQHKLQGTKLVIDGNSLYHFLYHNSKIPYKGGGQYRQFAEECQNFFIALDRSNVKPFVVMDGANPCDNSKLETSKFRARKRIQRAKKLVSHQSNYLEIDIYKDKEILPIMTHGQFLCSLTYLGVPHITSEFEADRPVASQAVSWNCPVLTNDSDLFIFDIPAGVIPLNANFEWRQTDACCYIPCQIFHHDKLCMLVLGEKHKSHDLIVIFATLLGNDYVKEKDLKVFLDKIQKETVQPEMKTDSREEKEEKRKQQIEYIALWLQSVKSVEDAKKTIMLTVHKDIGTQIENSMRKYSNFPTNSELAFARHCADYFDDHNRQDEIPLLDVETKAGNRLPEFFRRSVRAGRISPVMLNILINRRVFLPCQVEDIGERSSYCCSRRLRKILYGILLSIDDDTLGSSAAAQNIFVEEWTRKKSSIEKPDQVTPTWIVDAVDNVSILPLRSMQETNREIRQKFLMTALASPKCPASTDIDSFPRTVQFLIRVIQYWIVQTSPPVNEQHVHAVLLTMLKLGALNRIHVGLVSTDHTENYRDFNVDKSVIHAFAQFQTCFQAATDLTAVLLLEETVLEPKLVFSGCLMCGLYSELTSNPEHYKTFLASIGYPVDVYNGLLDAVDFRKFIAFRLNMNNKTEISEEKDRIIDNRFYVLSLLNGSNDIRHARQFSNYCEFLKNLSCGSVYENAKSLWQHRD